ncbi:phosphoribosyltransferase [candidate division KSB1 bacterium]|nr:phosphoribosyltransferase [candidate division KSB1 bacterium]
MDYSKQLAELLSQENVDIIIGIARAGLLPATTIACMLRKEYYPIRLTRRLNDEVFTETPQWKLRFPDKILKDKIVTIIDEISDTGKTLSIVTEEAYKFGAKQVISAVLISHSWSNPIPDYVILKTDELVIFPWDYKVYQKGEWRTHPEIEAAISEQETKLK